MKDEDLLQCCQAVLDFLCEEAPLQIPTPNRKIMDEVLSKNNWGIAYGDMIGFTEWVNNYFQMNCEVIDEDGNYKPFFSSEQSRNFYKHIIRELKLKQLLK